MSITFTSETPHVIVLKGELRKRHEERRAAGAIKPGHLIQMSADAQTVVVHATDGGQTAPWFAKEDALQGNTIDDAYASGDLVPYHMAQKGDRIYARVAAGSAAIVEGDPLTSDGDGTLKKGTVGTHHILGTAVEDLDNSAAIVENFIRVDIW